MTKKITIFLLIAIIIISIGWLAHSGLFSQLFYNKKITTSDESEENLKQEIVLVVDDGEGVPTTTIVNFKEEMNAFDLLRDWSEKSGTILNTKMYDVGILIGAIGNKENGDSGKYWLYYVNGEMPPVSADKKELKAGDKVEFKFRKSPF